MVDKGMPAGRPSDYDPAFCARAIELGESGASVMEIAYELGVCRNTLSNWAEQHPEFLKAFTRARMASQVWWERKGRDGMEKPSQEFQGNIWSRNMAARFPEDWTEKQKQDVSHSGELNHKVTRIELVGISPNDNSAG